MKLEFQDMEQKGEQPVRPIISLDELARLLDGLRQRQPFLFQLFGENGYCLTVGIAMTSGSVQFAAAKGNPPYFAAVVPSRSKLSAEQVQNPHALAFESDIRTATKSAEFACGGTATPVPSRYVVSFELLKKIIVHFFETGERFPSVCWEEI